MDNKVKQILNDLYMIDGSLKKQEKEIEQIVSELLESRPNVRIDDNFIRQLRAELVKRAKVMSAIEPKKQGMWSSIISGRKLAYSFTAVVMILAAIASVSYFFGQTGNNTPGGKVAVVSEREINKVKDNAFGSLRADLLKPSAELGSGGTGAGGGRGGISLESASKPGMPAPEAVNYHYIYKGRDIAVEDKVTVYKRVKGLPLENKIMENFSSLNLGLIDLSKLSGAQVNNLNISENRDFGYGISLDFREGMISMYSNANWPDPNAGCKDETCHEKNRLKESDIPKNEELIAIANKFLDDYGIDKSSYGDPVVVNGNYPQFLFKDNIIYVPESVPVLYPQKIEGQIVYDNMGNISGMAVDVNIRYKKALGVRDIFSQKYESSDYVGETDKSKIISLAEKGGVYGNYTYPEIQKTVDVELGTPKIELVAVWNYDPVNKTNNNLFVPAYVFPIIEIPENPYFYQKSVVVPMAKEMLERPDGGVGVTEPPIKSRININH